jgi:hypothetical protein
VDEAIFPLDEPLKLNRSAYSPQLARQLVWLSGLPPYQPCAAGFEEIGERLIPSTSIWRQTQGQGQGLQA